MRVGAGGGGGGVRVSCLLGVKTSAVLVVAVLLSFRMLWVLVWALGAMFRLGTSGGCWVVKFLPRVVAVERSLVGRAFWAGFVQERLKGRLLPLQAVERVGTGAWLGYSLLQVPWSESKKN